MLKRWMIAFFLPMALCAAPEWVLVRTVDGAQVEGQAKFGTLKIAGDQAMNLRLPQILSIHSGAPASEFEAGRITAGLAAIQGTARPERDAAVEELTNIGLPVLTPLLENLKDTDQHEPRPLYRLFERLIPSSADGFDRTLSLVRLRNGEMIRAKLPDDALELQASDGKTISLSWSKIRSLAVRQKEVRRTMPVHSLRHCTQIEYLDTGAVITASSVVNSSARGFVRLSWNTDGWASDPNGLTKPGSSAFKTNLVDGHPFGALVGRVGAHGDVFLLGKKSEKKGLAAGRLMLAINDNDHWQNNLGTYTVSLTATDAYDLGEAQ
jgi:hypothetical protein